MTHTRQYADDEGVFTEWHPTGRPCHKIIEASGLPCGHPVECREWESNDGSYEDFQFRCKGGGHIWWIDGIDS